MNTTTDSEAVLRAATELNTDPAVALAWLSSEVLTVFEGKTAAQLIAEGRADDVLRYIEMLGAGFCG